MGWDPESHQFQELSAEQAQTWTKGPVFRTGEEVILKGLTFTVVDIAPGQIKLKPKRIDHQEALSAAKATLEEALAKTSSNP